MQKISRLLFEELVQTNDYVKMDKVITQPLSRAFHKAVIEPMRETDKDKTEELEDQYYTLLTESEYLGFIQGFKTALQLKQECDLL